MLCPSYRSGRREHSTHPSYSNFSKDSPSGRSGERRHSHVKKIVIYRGHPDIDGVVGLRRESRGASERGGESGGDSPVSKAWRSGQSRVQIGT